MNKLGIVVLVFLAYGFWHNFIGRQKGELEQRHDDVIMYSLTTCGFCRIKARELHEANIPFEEYYIDKDPSYKRELDSKLEEAGYRPRSFGTPVLDVQGFMLPDNPSIGRIREHMVN